MSFVVSAARYARGPVWILGSLAFVAVVGLYGGSAIVALSLLPTAVDRIAGGLFYAALAGLLVWTFVTTTLHPRKFFLKSWSKYPAALEEPLDRLLPPTEESKKTVQAVKYLLLPRVADLIKWSIFLLAWGATTILYAFILPANSERRADDWGQGAIHAALFLLVFEFLVYQARYQWNDLRGAAQDREHPEYEKRRRLPEGFERHSLVVLVIRLLVAAYVVHLAFRHEPALLVPAYLIAVMPLVFAMPYELARSRSDRSGYTDQPRFIHYIVYLFVGLGYGLRATLGVYIGSLGDVSIVWLFFVYISVRAGGCGGRGYGLGVGGIRIGR